MNPISVNDNPRNPLPSRKGIGSGSSRGTGRWLDRIAVRGMLRVLNEKGLANFEAEGVRYVFSPATPRDEAAKTALDGLMTTFFMARSPSRIHAARREGAQDFRRGTRPPREAHREGQER